MNAQKSIDIQKSIEKYLSKYRLKSEDCCIVEGIVFINTNDTNYDHDKLFKDIKKRRLSILKSIKNNEKVSLEQLDSRLPIKCALDRLSVQVYNDLEDAVDQDTLFNDELYLYTKYATSNSDSVTNGMLSFFSQYPEYAPKLDIIKGTNLTKDENFLLGMAICCKDGYCTLVNKENDYPQITSFCNNLHGESENVKTDSGK